MDIESLKYCKPELVTRREEWAFIQDAIDGRPRLYQGKLEPDDEFTLRKKITPFFPHSPALLHNRLGALLPENVFAPTRSHAWRELLSNFTIDRRDLHAFANDAATAAQIYGLAGAYLDHVGSLEGTPPRPYLALIPATQIFDWHYGMDGTLQWIKLWEPLTIRAGVADRTRHLDRYTIAGTHTIWTYTVEKQENVGPVIINAHKTETDYGRVPFEFFTPDATPDRIGQSLLKKHAEADHAAGRILSDIVWSLYLLGQPLLTLTTDRTDEELENIMASASRYFPLRAARGEGTSAEVLKYVQLDTAGVEMMFKAHAMLEKRARDVHADESTAQPQSQSGVAIAWTFKTGEERVLHRLAASLENFLNRTLKLAGLTTPGTPPQVELPRDFSMIKEKNLQR